MSLEQIGNLAEAVGAAAVVVSLIYLSIQMRQNTQSVRSATYQAIVSSATAVNTTLTQDPALARILDVGSEDLSRLEGIERVQFSFLCSQFFDIFENLYLQYEHGSLDDDFFLPRQRAYLGLLQLPGFAHCWDERKGDYSASFASFVERERGTLGDARTRERLFLAGVSTPT